MNGKTPLEILRQEHPLFLPNALRHPRRLHVDFRGDSSPLADVETLNRVFPQTIGKPMASFREGDEHAARPLNIGVVFSGGQAAGGHNVVTGLFDALRELNPNSHLFGFLNGPAGIVKNEHRPLGREVLHPYRNQGGFDLLGSGRTKIETDEQFKAAEKTCRDLNLDGLVIIGGDDSNTNAAHLAEYFLAHRCKTAVVGVPKTIDGDLKNDLVEVSFGFDTACKTFAHTIGDLCRDTLSAKKYTFFVKLMGRSASHITLECALQTHPNVALIGEEVASQQKTLQQVVEDLCDVIAQRSRDGRDYGMILIPEGLIEFIPEVKTLIQELNALLAKGSPQARALDGLTKDEDRLAFIAEKLTAPSRTCFANLPALIQQQLLLDRDPHGNVQVSKIETERLLIDLVERSLKQRREKGLFKGKFSAQPIFLGYEGRSCLPSNFDSQYCYSLGYVAALLLNAKATGYMACVGNLAGNVEDWTISGIPITSLLHLEERHGKNKPVIAKALVDLDGQPFAKFAQQRKAWAATDDYRCPGPIQFAGPSEVVNGITETLHLEQRQAVSL